mgnify:FL=1
MAEEKINNTRTRINISTNSKGFAQFDLTCEYDTPELSVQEMSKTIDMVRDLLKQKGMAEASIAS